MAVIHLERRSRLVAREANYPAGDGFYYGGHNQTWWNSDQAVYIKWFSFFVFVALITSLMFAYWHASMRVRKGLVPLGYHGWMVNRQNRTPPQAMLSTYNAGYGMNNTNNIPPPPPMYDPSSPPPPNYEQMAMQTPAAPQDPNKMDPSAWRTQPTRRPN